MVELQGYCVAYGYLGGVAEDVAGGVGGYGVAAFESAQGAAFFELQAETIQPIAFDAEQALGASGQVRAEFFQAQTQGGDLHPKVEGNDAEMSGGVTLAAALKVGAEELGEARGHFVGALALLAEEIEGAAEAAAAGEFVDAAAENEDAVAHLIGEGAAQVGYVFVEFAARLDHEFSSCGRR